MLGIGIIIIERLFGDCSGEQAEAQCATGLYPQGLAILRAVRHASSSLPWEIARSFELQTVQIVDSLFVFGTCSVLLSPAVIAPVLTRQSFLAGPLFPLLPLGALLGTLRSAAPFVILPVPVLVVLAAGLVAKDPVGVVLLCLGTSFPIPLPLAVQPLLPLDLLFRALDLQRYLRVEEGLQIII